MKMGYRKVVINGEEYKLTPKWYKEYLSAIELWKKAKETDTKDIDISELVDIRDVKIDKNKPYPIRIISYINQIKHPYCFRVGDVKVRVSYAGKDDSLNDSFTALISSM